MHSLTRAALNLNDDVALLRVLNTPPRGIGAKSLDGIRGLARAPAKFRFGMRSANMIADTPGGLAPLRSFRMLIEQLEQDVATLPPADFLNHVLERTGYLDMLEQHITAEDAARAENFKELVNAVAESAVRGQTLSDFLAMAALVSDADTFDDRASVT